MAYFQSYTNILKNNNIYKMKYIKKFESSIKNSIDTTRELKYEIDCLLMDLIDSDFEVNLSNKSTGWRKFLVLDISSKTSGFYKFKPVKRFENIVDYILSLIDFLKTKNFTYYNLGVFLGHRNIEIKCKIEDGKLKSYPLKDNKYIADYLIRGIRIEFEQNNIINPNFLQVGDIVNHEYYGKGEVISFEGIGQNKTILVKFNDVEKQFLLRYSKFTK